VGRRRAVIGVLTLVLGLGALGATGSPEAKPPKRKAAPARVALTPAAATRAFALDLLRSRKGNVVFSPHSIATALAMAGKGAAGLTARQIATTLHLKGPGSFDDVGQLQTAIVDDQEAAALGDPDPPTLSMVNGLFVQRGFPIKPAFFSSLRTHFGAAPELADFERDLAGALAAINAWVSTRTSGLIPELFDSLPELTRLVLLNAVYLDADWRYPFNPARNSFARFKTPDGSVSVEFMNDTSQLRYGLGSDYEAVDLPYRGSTLSFLVVLPKRSELVAFERRLRPRKLARITRQLSPPTRVAVRMPHFHLNTHAKLNRTLIELGMPAAFSEGADFSRITRGARLKIGTVMHAVDLKVDEAGTVAAAATGVGIEVVSRPITIDVDRPFLFFLRDRKTGAILFAGRITNPATADG
jgi:serpin B